MDEVYNHFSLIFPATHNAYVSLVAVYRVSHSVYTVEPSIKEHLLKENSL